MFQEATRSPKLQRIISEVFCAKVVKVYTKYSIPPNHSYDVKRLTYREKYQHNQDQFLVKTKEQIFDYIVYLFIIPAIVTIG